MRLSLLRYSKAAGAHGMTFALFLQYLRAEGQHVDADELLGEILYLEDKQLLVLMPKTISPENKAWRLTAGGRDFLAERGIE